MIIVEELKHNKFQDVNIPSGADLFARVGPRASSDRDYSGEEYLDPSIGKIDAAKMVLDESMTQPATE